MFYLPFGIRLGFFQIQSRSSDPITFPRTLCGGFISAASAMLPCGLPWTQTTPSPRKHKGLDDAKLHGCSSAVHVHSLSLLPVGLRLSDVNAAAHNKAMVLRRLCYRPISPSPHEEGIILLHYVLVGGTECASTQAHGGGRGEG